MNCPNFENQIALYVGNDLPAGEIPALERHLSECEACRQFAAEMGECGQEVRMLAAEDFDDAVYALLRAQVLHQISLQEPKRSFWQRWLGFPVVRLAFASLLLAVLVWPLASLWRSDIQPGPGAQRLPGRTLNPPVPVDVKKNEAQPSIESAMSAPVTKKQPSHLRRPGTANSTQVRTTTEPVETARMIPAPGSEAMKTTPVGPPIRMEIPTADPNIRIIWFANNPTESGNPTT